MSRPGSGPGLARRAAYAAAALGLAGGAATLGTLLRPPGAARAIAAASATTTTTAGTTTTTNPWVPGINGTMTVGIDQAPTGCNPNTASGDTWADRLVLAPVLPSAFQINGNDQPVYDAALITQAELQSTSPETVVYTINPKAVWSDGRPVTAADFIYTWRQERGTTGPLGPVPPTGTTAPSATGTPPVATPVTATTPATATPTTSPTPTPTAVPPTTVLPGATGTTGPAVGYRQITSMKAGNHGRTVTVVFKTPYADWQSLFDDLLPAHVLAKTGWNPACTTVSPAIDLSAGPYVISKVVPGQEIVLTRNPRWWEQQPTLARIIVRIASGPTQLAQWLANGTVDVALPTAYSAHYLQAVTSQPALVSQSQLSTTFLQIEFSTTSPATAPVDVRQAIAHAINRQALLNSVVGWADSSIVPAASHLFSQTQSGYPSHKPPPLQVSGQPGYSPTTASGASPTATPFPATADPAATSRLLTALGYLRLGSGPWTLPTGKVLSLRMAVDTADPWTAQTAAIIVRQLGAAGITVSLVAAPDAQAAGVDVSAGRADMALLPMHSSPYPSQAISWYTPLLGAPGSGGSQDWSNFDNPTVNGLLEKASQELNPVDAAPIYTQVDALLWQDMVGLPLFAQPSTLAWSGLTSGVTPNPNGPGLLWSPQNWAMRVPPTSPDTQAG